jgi:two-component system, cell cycle response regulator
VENSPLRVILVDVSEQSREVLVRRLSSQGYAVEAADDPVTGADMALSSPPAVVIADLWMPSISGVQLCRLLKAEPATADVPVILRGHDDDPRSRFWAERAGAAAYVRKGAMGALVRALSKAAAHAPDSDGFFMQLGGGSIDIRDRIARHLDSALFDSVIAAEVRSLASCGSFERLFDLFAQFLSQVMPYRWVAISTSAPDQFGLHHHPGTADEAESTARATLGIAAETEVLRVADEDARSESEGSPVIVCSIPFGNLEIGRLALAPITSTETDTAALLGLVARELGGPIRIAALMDEQKRLAAIDPLTGLRNRRAFLEQAQIEVARCRRYGIPLSIMLLDVDHFKAINDTHGHAGGDQVLAAMGALLRKQLRVPDLCARWGGEEFVVALTNTQLAGAAVVGERLREAVEAMRVESEGRWIRATSSFGVVELGLGESLDGCIDRADRAMYAAKVGGRNRVVVAEQPELAHGSEATPSLSA